MFFEGKHPPPRSTRHTCRAAELKIGLLEQFAESSLILAIQSENTLGNRGGQNILTASKDNRHCGSGVILFHLRFSFSNQDSLDAVGE